MIDCCCLSIPFSPLLNVFYSDHFVLPLPAGHRFPMQKYRLIREGAQATISDIEFHEAPPATDGMLALAHHPDYTRRISTGASSAAEQKDRLGRLKLTLKGLEIRDRLVLEQAYQRNIPVAVTMVGGYGRNMQDTVAVHLQTIAIVADYAQHVRTDRAVTRGNTA
jgi:acetoin utilization deacetylase AcuC-like enzyme